MGKKSKSSSGPTIFPGRGTERRTAPNPDGNRKERREAERKDKKRDS